MEHQSEKVMSRSQPTTIAAIKLLVTVISLSPSPNLMLGKEHCATMANFQLAAVACSTLQSSR